MTHLNLKTDPIVDSFEIIGFAGDRDIEIRFSNAVKILIADNGAGKTTVLNSLHAFLAERWDKLLQVDFESMKLTFSNGKTAEIAKENLFPLLESPDLFGKSPENVVWQRVPTQTLLNIARRSKRSDIHELSRRYEIPASMIDRTVRRIRSGREFESPALGEATEVINESFPYRLLFLPTYRRIEEELTSLGSEMDIQFIDSDIQFGMSDVQQQIEDITTTIRKAYVEAISAISGEMVNQLIAGLKVTNEMQTLVQNREAVEIVLARAGGNILQENKQKLIELISSDQLATDQFEPLVYFLSALVRIYEQQKVYDEAIKAFTKVCNEYLVDKEVTYDESSVDVHIAGIIEGRDIPLHKLSSGEKQIVSLFSKLYLDNVEGTDRPYAIFFDEPELSLSIQWQSLLLPHILNSNRCAFLFCTTHSPFIFDNELDEYAIGLDRYVTKYG